MGTKTVNVIDLGRFKHLFKDESSYEEFVTGLRESLRYDLRPIMSNSEVLGASLSAEGIKDVLYDRFVRALSRNPSLIDKLTERIQDDEIVG